MLKMIEVMGTEGTIELPLYSNGMTKVHFRRVFGHDLEGILLKINEANEGKREYDEVDLTYPEKLAFIMNMSAVGEKAKDITIDKFYEWLEQFEATTLSENANLIVGVYQANKDITSSLKNAPSPPNEK